MKVSVLIPIHRYGGIDVLHEGLHNQTFPWKDFEVILCDRLYGERKELIEQCKDINVKHFPPSKRTNYHAHSSVLNDCLREAEGKLIIVAGDYTYFPTTWIESHWEIYKKGYICSSPQMIFGLPKLKINLHQMWSVFEEDFKPDILKILPQHHMDPKLQLGNGIIDHRYCYSRNESFPKWAADNIGGWDERYDETVGPSNLEFYLRLSQENKLQIANINDSSIIVYRLLSYPIPPFTEFKASEMDDSRNKQLYKELCEKYGVPE